MSKKKRPKIKVRIRKVPKKQLDNPAEIHPTKDGIFRVTPENALMAQTMFLQQIRASNAQIQLATMKTNKLMEEFLKAIREE